MVETGGSQFRHFRLSIVLILVAELCRSVNETNIWLASDRDADGIDEVEKAPRSTGSDIEQVTDRRVLKQPSDRGDAVLYINKVSQLTAISVARIMRLKQVDRLASLDRRVDFADDGLHDPFVGFVCAIDIEKLEPGPLRRGPSTMNHVVDDAAVNDVLAPAIGIKRAQRSESSRALIVAETGAAVAIGRGGGCLDEGRGIRCAPFPQVNGQADIVFNEPVDIGFGRRGDRRHVDDRCDFVAVTAQPF